MARHVLQCGGISEVAAQEFLDFLDVDARQRFLDRAEAAGITPRKLLAEVQHEMMVRKDRR